MPKGIKGSGNNVDINELLPIQWDKKLKDDYKLYAESVKIIEKKMSEIEIKWQILEKERQKLLKYRQLIKYGREIYDIKPKKLHTAIPIKPISNKNKTVLKKETEKFYEDINSEENSQETIQEDSYMSQ
jgi:hypothetical protein